MSSLWGEMRVMLRRGKWLWWLLNLMALALLAYVLSQGTTGWIYAEGAFDRMLESGKWGIRFLLLSLAMTPLHTYARWSGALKLRKPAGLWAFAFGVAHFGLYTYETYEPIPIYRTNGTPWHWLSWSMQPYLALGLLALCILCALAVTSNKWSMRRLGKRWKPLHRLVYGAGIAVCIHALLASTMSKKMLVRDPHVVPELRLYLGILALMLIVRLPQVRSLLLKLIALSHPKVRTIESPSPTVPPNRMPASRPLPVPTLMDKPSLPGTISMTIEALPEMDGERLPEMAEMVDASERELVH
jgi:sulfoxide reductase heme-binding subunit YedZ